VNIKFAFLFYIKNCAIYSMVVYFKETLMKKYILYKKRLYEYKMNLRRIITSRSYNNEGKQKNTQLR